MEDCIDAIKRGGVAVIPTDTIYGIVARADNPEAVERVYAVKGRAPEKPSIILIGKKEDLSIFDIILSEEQENFLNKHWPGAVSVILECTNERFAYLHRGTKSLSFRLPDNKALIELLEQTGPLSAPSANPENQKPASTVDEARVYFGDAVDCYMDGGMSSADPSTLVRLGKAGEVEVLRVGSVATELIQ